jgi:hypothetical protein
VPLKFTKQKCHYVGKRCFQISTSDEIITHLINIHEKDPPECTLFSYCMYMFSRVNSYFKGTLKRYWKLHACRKSLLFNDKIYIMWNTYSLRVKLKRKYFTVFYQFFCIENILKYTNYRRSFANIIAHVIDHSDLKDVTKRIIRNPHVIVKYLLIHMVVTAFVQEHENAFKSLFTDNSPL